MRLQTHEIKSFEGADHGKATVRMYKVKDLFFVHVNDDGTINWAFYENEKEALDYFNVWAA